MKWRGTARYGHAIEIEGNEIIRQQLVPQMREDGIRLAKEPPDAIEVFSAQLVSGPVLRAMPQGLVDDLIGALAEEPALHVLLRGLAAASPPKLAEPARRAVDALAPLPGRSVYKRLGTLEVERAFTAAGDDPGSDGLFAICRRRGLSTRQIVNVLFDPGLDNAIRDATISAPISPRMLADVLESLEGAPEVAIVELDAEGVATCLRDLVARSVAAGVGPSDHGLAAICLLVRAAKADGGEDLLARLSELPPQEPLEGDDDEIEYDEDLHEELVVAHERIARAFGEHTRLHEGKLTADEADHYEFVAEVMGTFLAGYHMRRADRWAPHHVDEFLLDYLPRKVVVERPFRALTVDAAASYLRFLGIGGHLTPTRARSLAFRALANADGVAERLESPDERGGLAQLMSGALAGFDPSDPEALRAIIDSFNELPEHERQAALRSSATRGKGTRSRRS